MTEIIFSFWHANLPYDSTMHKFDATRRINSDTIFSSPRQGFEPSFYGKLDNENIFHLKCFPRIPDRWNFNDVWRLRPSINDRFFIMQSTSRISGQKQGHLLPNPSSSHRRFFFRLTFGVLQKNSSRNWLHY